MTDKTRNHINELDQMTMGQLRARYAEAFGEPTRSGNRQWLVRRIAWRLQALAEGDLTARARSRAAELARDADLRVQPPTDRGPGLGANLRTASGRVVSRIDDRVPIPGTVLSRTHKGVEYRVTVLPHGFEYENNVYRSLSAVATAISGSHWNGFHFFGLTRTNRSPRKETT